jgi:antitoxin ParD1/3/4
MLPIFANRGYAVVRESRAMPTRNINLTPQMDKFVDARIRSGKYANASEVLRAGLRALEQSERENHARLEALRTALEAGEASGIADGDVVGEVRDRIRRRAMITGTL